MSSAVMTFWVLNLGVLPAWGLLFCSPAHQHFRKRFIAVLVMLYALTYGVLLTLAIIQLGVGFSQDWVAAVMKHPAGFLASWIHYLVCDLIVGTWINDDASRREMRKGVVRTSLILAILFGPLGILNHLIAIRLTSKLTP